MARTSFSERTRAKLAIVTPALSAASARVLDRARDGLYPEYLLTMHGISRAAVPLIDFALRRARECGSSDPVAAALCEYLERHADEERGHAEWVLEDLDVTGFDRAVLRERLPSATVAALVGAQYYWIDHVHPVALIGYLTVMEANPPSLDAVAELVAATGLPESAFRSMRLHAGLDVRHREELYRSMDRLPVAAWHERLVGTSALHTAELLTQALTEFVAAFDALRGPVAAASRQ